MSTCIEFTLKTPTMGEYKIRRVLPRKKDPWGAFRPLKDTPWAALFSTVTGEALSHALHGEPKFLANSIGSPPEALIRRVPADGLKCSTQGICPIFRVGRCTPGPRMPECFTLDDPLKAQVIQALREGYYLLIVQGAEFV